MESPPPQRQPSAFAAAFFSAIIPGLGQAYLRHWMRALVWVAPYVLLIALGAGVVRTMGVKDFAAQFTAPSWLVGTLVGIVIDLIYRVLSALDAYRIAMRDGARSGSVAPRLASVAGLVAILLVLVMAHVAVARPVYLTYDAITSVTQDSGDDTPLGSEPPDLASLAPPSLAPTPTDAPGVTPGPTDTPMPTATQGPPWDGKKRLNILLIGADSGRADYGGYLTDTMIVVSIDPQTGRMALISLPRDTQGIPLPKAWPAYRAYGGSYPSKINSLYSVARYNPSLFPGNDKTRGYEALKGTLGELYGLDIPYYVAVDLRGFRSVIDTLGGIVIDVQVPVYDSHYPTDDGRGLLKLYVPPGIQYMTGPEALAYARARHATSDFDRAARQQRVVTSLREQINLSSLLAPGVIPELFNEVKKSVKTDIPPELFPKLVTLAESIDFNRRVSLVLTPPTYSTSCYLEPACPNLYVLNANVNAIKRGVQQALNSDPNAEDQRQELEGEAAQVSVINGTPGPNIKTTAIADYLASVGIDATVPPVNGGVADRTDYTDTVITAYNGIEQDMPTTVQVLEDTFGVKVQTADDANQSADFVVIVGASTPPLKAPN